MTSEEMGAIFFLIGYAALFLLAVRTFGLKRVLWGLALLVFVAVAVAFKTLGAVTGGRRY